VLVEENIANTPEELKDVIDGEEEEFVDMSKYGSEDITEFVEEDVVPSEYANM